MKRKKIKRDILLEKTDFQGTYQQYMDEWIVRIEAPEYLFCEVPKEGMYELLHALRSRADSLYLATMRQIRGNLLAQLGQLKLREYFDRIYSTSPLQEKSKAEIIGPLTADTGEILVIGDSEADEALAESLHAAFFAMTDGLREADSFATPYRFQSLTELQDRIRN
jgi:phosphoglycolate phosphatase-like HAD superfamily hydrolase